MRDDVQRTGIQTDFSKNAILVSKTNPNGVIIYANPDFGLGAGYELAERLGKPHSRIRHPDMPQAVFSLMWETLKAQREFFGYVLNRCADGNHYSVFAQVVPDIDSDTCETVSFHSTRRWAEPAACGAAMEIYRCLLDVEARERSPRAAVTAGRAELAAIFEKAAITYEQSAFSLGQN